jgi:hypothetical protein
MTSSGLQGKTRIYNMTDVARRLSQVDNTTLSVDILARAVSTAVREYTSREDTMNDGRVPASGWTWASEVHVRVSWAWITLPAVLELARGRR